VAGRKTHWAVFCQDESGTASLEYMIIVASVGMVLAGLLSNSLFGVSALYDMIFNTLKSAAGKT
jgi:Flp pilus assembly pilin Flp